MITRRIELNRRRLHMCVDICETGYERTRGLLLRRRLRTDHALLIPRCSAVHTVGLWYPLDLAFCHIDGTVLGVVRQLPPWRFARHEGASEVWELAPGVCVALDLQPGDRLAAR
jgi:uncharacterized membrane protein (UPF0127 family)